MHGCDVGDYIGTESGVDLITRGSCSGGGGGRDGKRDQRSGTGREMVRKGTKEFPPPIRCLTRAENAPSLKLPWIMKRYYTTDGRLIIREEKSPNSDFLRVHRSNGRLTLQLVPFVDGGDRNKFRSEEGRESVEVVDGEDVVNSVAGVGCGGEKALVSCGGVGAGVGVNCYNYGTVVCM